MPDQNIQPPSYNNKRFKVSDYNFEMFVGPRAGDQVKEFTFTDLNTGSDVKLSDFEYTLEENKTNITKKLLTIDIFHIYFV